MSMRRYSVSIDDRAFTIDVIETAADRFEVTVDGRTFEAELHDDRDLPGSDISPEIRAADPRAGRAAASGAEPAAGAPASPAIPEASPAETRASRPPSAGPRPAPVSGAADVLAAPMPGVVLEVLVAAGASVRRGDPILVLEAMKMRNTIRCPHDGVVLEVAVAAGQPVGPGDVLVRLGDGPG